MWCFAVFLLDATCFAHGRTCFSQSQMSRLSHIVHALILCYSLTVVSNCRPSGVCLLMPLPSTLASVRNNKRKTSAQVTEPTPFIVTHTAVLKAFSNRAQVLYLGKQWNSKKRKSLLVRVAHFLFLPSFNGRMDDKRGHEFMSDVLTKHVQCGWKDAGQLHANSLEASHPPVLSDVHQCSTFVITIFWLFLTLFNKLFNSVSL